MRRLSIGGGPENPLAGVLGDVAAFTLGFPAESGRMLALPVLLGLQIVELDRRRRLGIGRAQLDPAAAGGTHRPHMSLEAMARLGKLGIGSRPFFWPMHEQPVFRRMGLFAGERYPVAERIARRGFYIPSGMALTDEQLERSAAAVREVLR